MKKGILVVSFGSSYVEAFTQNIRPMERAIQKAFPDSRFRRAYSSKKIAQKLEKRDKIRVETTQQALESLLAEGVTDLTVQPTFFIHGIEFDILVDTLRSYSNQFASIRVGRPLLNVVSDYEAVIEGILNSYTLEPEEALILMGHGTEHFANAAYPALEQMFHAKGHGRIFVGTVEGYPSLDTVLGQLKGLPVSAVTIAPLMLVAGDHARNDMAGDSPESWKNRLEQAGYRVRCDITGLGTKEYIQTLFTAHARQAQPI